VPVGWRKSFPGDLPACYLPSSIISMAAFFIDPDIARANTLSADFYTSPGYFEEAREKIFAESWQFAGHKGLVPDHGDCHPFTLLENYLDEPLLLSNVNGNIHCLSNVCTHRGNLLVHESCKLSKIRCRYHGRMFEPDGRFISMPEFKEVANFPTKADDLAKMNLFNWGEWLFVGLQPALSAGTLLAEMMQRLDWLPVDEFVFHSDLSKDYVVNAHWALYCENYLEGFHIPFVHPALNAALDFGSYTTEILGSSVLQIGIAKDDEDCFDLPAGSIDHGKKIAAYYYFIFPNLMLNFYPWGLSVNVVKPVTLSKTVVSFYTYVWNEEKLQTGAGGDVDNTEMEDEAIVEAVQKGIRSRFYQHGRYSVKHEKGTHRFHQLIAECMNR
jgi:choline monooxygenase